jgi:hypothetical protein
MTGEIHIQTHRLIVKICEVTVGIGTGAMIYIPSFIRIGSGMQKLIGRGGYTDSTEFERAYFHFSK